LFDPRLDPLFNEDYYSGEIEVPVEDLNLIYFVLVISRDIEPPISAQDCLEEIDSFIRDARSDLY